jgi:hypothetical protein
MAATLPKRRVAATAEGPLDPGIVGSVSATPFSRRRLLAGGGILAAGGALAACGAGASDDTGAGSTTTAAGPPASRVALVDGVKVRVADWVIAENKRPGTLDWILGGYPPAGQHLEGFASATSVATGGKVDLMVNCSDTSYRIEAYRMGYYQGYGGRMIAKSPTLKGVAQPPAKVDPSHGTVECPWNVSWTADLRGWPPGMYLFRLVSASNWQQWIPFVVRQANESTSAYVLMSAVTTYQAYNTWGGWSLYKDESGANAKRATIVSFDRPYVQTWEQGAADFFGNEFPVLYDMERLGLDLDYWTDIDLHLRGQFLKNHQSLWSTGHDEYWSTEMRDHATVATKAGTNLAFLGANAIYRKIRLAPSSFGAARTEICYKSTSDPVTASDPDASTVEWGSPPVNKPACELTGSTYISISADDDLTITDPGGWFWKGAGVTEGQHLSKVVQGEYNRYIPGQAGPSDVQLFGHSPITKQGSWSDITYITRPGGGGVLSTGMASWVYKMSNSSTIPAPMVPNPIPGITPILLRSMLNLYGLFGTGPASATQPAQSNWKNYYH